MQFRSALFISALALAPNVAFAQTNQSVDSETIIVTARPDPEDPAVVAQARAQLSETPGAVSVVSNESFESRSAVGLTDILRDVPGVLVAALAGEVHVVAREVEAEPLVPERQAVRDPGLREGVVGHELVLRAVVIGVAGAASRGVGGHRAVQAGPGLDLTRHVLVAAGARLRHG